MRTWRLRVTDDLLARHTAGRWRSWSLYPPLILTLTLRITHGATNCLTTMGPGSLRGVRPRGQLHRSSLGRLRSGPRVLPGAGWREQEAAVVVSWTTWAGAWAATSRPVFPSPGFSVLRAWIPNSAPRERAARPWTSPVTSRAPFSSINWRV